MNFKKFWDVFFIDPYSDLPDGILNFSRSSSKIMKKSSIRIQEKSDSKTSLKETFFNICQIFQDKEDREGKI